MKTDTAGNPIYTVPAYCGTCLAPTNTGGICPNGCESGPIVAASTAEDWKGRALKAEARLARVVEMLRDPTMTRWDIALAAAQPEEAKPLFEAGVTLDAAGKRLSTALGHIADGTVLAAVHHKE